MTPSLRQLQIIVHVHEAGNLTRAFIGSPLTPLFLLASLALGLVALVTLRAGAGGQAPLFLPHAVGGTVDLYRDLVKGALRAAPT